jgi:hypothetical protein
MNPKQKLSSVPFGPSGNALGGDSCTEFMRIKKMQEVNCGHHQIQIEEKGIISCLGCSREWMVI